MNPWRVAIERWIGTIPIDRGMAAACPTGVKASDIPLKSAGSPASKLL